MSELQRQRFANALVRVAGDEDTLTMLAAIAVEDAPPMMELLDTQTADQSLIEAARTAHSLKGLLSAFETGEPVSDLELLIEACRQHNAVEAAEVLQRIKPKLQTLVSEIKAITKV